MREIVKNINNCVYTQTLPARQKTRPDPKRLKKHSVEQAARTIHKPLRIRNERSI